MNLKIIFENENFIVVDKEAMVLTTPSRLGVQDSRPCLGTTLQTQSQSQIFPVHRLDFEVSGLVIYAKNAKAHSAANSWFEQKSVFKTYCALSEGEALTAGEKFLWKSCLLRGKKRSYEHQLGKNSETEALYLGSDPNTGWHQWELHPLTGRPHQLRYELSRHGHPIVGDQLYGSRTSFFEPGIALRALRIDFSKAPQAKHFGLPISIEASSRWSLF